MPRRGCAQGRLVRRLVPPPHGEALAAEIDAECELRREIPGWLQRRCALLTLWTEISPRLLWFALERHRTALSRAPHTGGFMDSFAFMLRSAVRSLSRRPAFTALIVLTLGLGIGANTAVFSIVNGVLLEPLPYHDADRLVTVMKAPGAPGSPRGSMSFPDLDDIRRDAPSVERMAGLSATTVTLTGLGDPELFTATRVSGGLLDIFGVTPALGRDIRADEFGPDAPRVVVVSHRFWQQRFGGDMDVVGQTLTVNGQVHEIVGVAPEGFGYPNSSDLWYPRRISLEGCGRGCHTWTSIARLAPGATVASAQAEADAIAANLEEQYPATNLGKRFAVTSLRDVTVGDVRSGLWLLLGAVGAVLLIACANVAHLMLARATSRRTETAVRAALGATPRQLAGSLMIESMVLALLGGVAALAMAALGMRLLRALSVSNLPRAELIGIDGTVLLFTLGTTALVALLFGTLPSLHLARVPLLASLGSAARDTGGGVGGRRLRNVLTAVEVAISVVLLVGAGLLLRTFAQLYAVDPGFETHNIVRFSLALPAANYPSLEHQRTTFRALEDAIESLPGVESVGSVYGAPMDVASTAGDVIIEGVEPPTPGTENSAALRPVSPRYLTTMRIPLLVGRYLEPADDVSDRYVAVVNEAFVRENFSGREPLGEGVNITVDNGFGSPIWTIVGVVGDVHSNSLQRDPRPEVYVPHGRFGSSYMNVNVRTAGEPLDLVEAIRGELRAVDPDVPLQRIETVQQVLDRDTQSTRFFLVGIGLFAAVATVLAAVGLYGVMAYLVSMRTPEIGVRVALGADRGHITRMVLVDGLRPTVAGLVAGTLLALAGGRAMESLLFGVTARDPLILLAVPTLLAAIAFLAIVTPALRASRVDPLRSLRAN